MGFQTPHADFRCKYDVLQLCLPVAAVLLTVVRLWWCDLRYIMYLAYYKRVTLCNILCARASWQHEMFSILNQELAVLRRQTANARSRQAA